MGETAKSARRTDVRPRHSNKVEARGAATPPASVVASFTTHAGNASGAHDTTGPGKSVPRAVEGDRAGMTARSMGAPGDAGPMTAAPRAAEGARNAVYAADFDALASSHGTDEDARRWTDPLPAPREEPVRALLAALSPEERALVYRDLRDFLRALHGAYVADSFNTMLRTTFDSGSAKSAHDSARDGIAPIAAALEVTPYRHALGGCCALLMARDPSGLVDYFGEDDGAAEARRTRRALRILRAAYTATRGGAR